MPSNLLGLTLVRWQGVYEGVEAPWLRWATLDGMLVPTPWEAADAARAEAERERQLRVELGARIAELEWQERGLSDPS